VAPAPTEFVEEAGLETGSAPVTGTGTAHGTGSIPGSRRTRSRTSSSRGRLGAGLVDVPRVPYKDPASAMMEDAVVQEEKRFCGNCSKPVGRGQHGEPGNPDGSCANCGTSFSFLPKLKAGDLLGGQYEVLGCLAYGGLGWIYLAKDHAVNDRWVVLKGMIDTGDPAAMAAAVAEREFLASVEHPNILKIYNFVQHPDPKTGSQVGYIVMEYVGGQSLRQLALARHKEAGRPESLPLAQVLAYGLEILPALGYLHSTGLLYCDLKPDNVIHQHEQLKLIDLGAVRRMDDWESPIFFTQGYAAPELASKGPSVASDIYTVGRTLAVLSFDFVGYTSKFLYELPPVKDIGIFSLFESYHRLLRKACDPEPDNRFTSCEEMADQLTGVLREVLALTTREPRPGRSTVFGPELHTFGAETWFKPSAGPVPPPPDYAEVVTSLPVPQVDTSDPAAGLLATATGVEPAELLSALTAAPATSLEAKLWRARARTQLGELGTAVQELDAAAQLVAAEEEPPDWRVTWYRGLVALAARRPRDARPLFEAVYDSEPGELAPKLALAASLEFSGDFFGASRYYELVWRTDRAYVSAAFGLARVYLAQGDRRGAIESLEAVPDRSSHYVAAQVAAITIRTLRGPQGTLAEQDILTAAAKLERLRLDAERREKLATEVLQAAYDWVRSGQPGAAPQGAKVLGCALDEKELRFGLERSYRSLARLTTSPTERVALVDKANTIRPRTLT
jgi:serine/threonine-protein kinase PknG